VKATFPPSLQLFVVLSLHLTAFKTGILLPLEVVDGDGIVLERLPSSPVAVHTNRSARRVFDALWCVALNYRSWMSPSSVISAFRSSQRRVLFALLLCLIPERSEFHRQLVGVAAS